MASVSIGGAWGIGVGRAGGGGPDPSASLATMRSSVAVSRAARRQSSQGNYRVSQKNGERTGGNTPAALHLLWESVAAARGVETSPITGSAAKAALRPRVRHSDCPNKRIRARTPHRSCLGARRFPIRVTREARRFAPSCIPRPEAINKIGTAHQICATIYEKRRPRIWPMPQLTRLSMGQLPS